MFTVIFIVILGATWEAALALEFSSSWKQHCGEVGLIVPFVDSFLCSQHHIRFLTSEQEEFFHLPFPACFSPLITFLTVSW